MEMCIRDRRKALADPKTAAYKNVAFFYFVQFVLDRQMQEAPEHAKAKGVILKGDIPIGVNRNGCDVWTEPKYFNLNGPVSYTHLIVVPTQNAVLAIFGVFLASYLYYIKIGMGRLPINLSFLCRCV